MKRVLFITGIDVASPNIKGGGAMIAKRNYELISLFSDVTLVAPPKKTNILNKIGKFLSCRICFTNKEVRAILHLAKSGDFDIIYLDQSFHGNLLKKLKNLNAKKITFFHNVEVKYFKDVEKKLVRIVRKNEQSAVQYSDEIIVLNNRDRLGLIREYPLVNTKKIHFLPITLKNTFIENENQIETEEENNKKIGLFLGSFFPPNYNGIKWFVENVAEKTNADYYIVGKGFESVREELSRDNVIVIGETDDVASWYKKVDFIVSPIFEGSGMKVKTCEALMYGKTIFGTDEAFEGYELDFNLVGDLCNTTNEFVEKINFRLDNNLIQKQNGYNREVFLTKYEDIIAIQKFKEVILDKEVE
ncbi:MAG: glycosyltransferase family 4 protein [Defluviitaleaceae bacterium]|nr:glycosyltransferase family 4 protein [Defluviitaleaceae bacterium]